MSVFNWIYILSLFSFKTCTCCPVAYTHCANENSQCTGPATNVIAFGRDGHRWAYKEITGSFTCSWSLFGDPAQGIAKECCYQTNKITNIPTFSNPSFSTSWAVNTIYCNQWIHGYSDQGQNVVYKFIKSVTGSATFSNCDSEISDTKMYIYDSAGNSVMSEYQTTLKQNKKRENEDKSDSSRNRLLCCGNNEEFWYDDMPAGTYCIRFAPFSSTSSGNYEIIIECDGAESQVDYGENVVTCQNNVVHSVTTTDNREQYFQITTKSKWDMTVESCGTAYDSNLYVYRDSLYVDELGGGDNDACASGYQESYNATGLNPGHYYIRMGAASGCTNWAIAVSQGFNSNSDSYGDSWTPNIYVNQYSFGTIMVLKPPPNNNNTLNGMHLGVVNLKQDKSYRMYRLIWWLWRT